MKLIRKEEYDYYTLEGIQEIVRAGEAGVVFPVGSQLVITFDGKPALYDVIGIDAEEPADTNLKHSMTIQAHTLLEKRPFDTKGRYGSNVWETSELRAYLNSEEYAKRYEDLVPYLAAVRKKNNSGADTIDTFFLPSREEYGDVDEVEPYEYYKTGEIARVKADEDGETDWHWTRSAYRGYAYYVWLVYASGYVYSYGTASTPLRFAPACVIA